MHKKVNYNGKRVFSSYILHLKKGKDNVDKNVNACGNFDICFFYVAISGLQIFYNLEALWIISNTHNYAQLVNKLKC